MGQTMSHIISALGLLANESWNTEDPATRDHWRVHALWAREELDALRAELAQVRADNETGALAYEDLVKALAERNSEVESLRANNSKLRTELEGFRENSSRAMYHEEIRLKGEVAKAKAELRLLDIDREYRDHAHAYKRVCETLGYADGADGRAGMHYADADTVCRALREMRATNERLTGDEHERRMETGE